MKNAKRICILHAQVPFIRGGAEMMVESLTEELTKCGYESELISIPFKWYPENSLLDSCLNWRLLDLSESDGNKIDLVIATKFPSYLINHSNKVLWLMHQYREAYDLADNSNYCGLNTTPGGKELKERIINIDNKAISEYKTRYTISQNVSNRLRDYNGISSTPLYHPPKHVGRYTCCEFQNYILSIGRLDLKKRVDLLIESLQYCDSSISAYIGGRGPELENLKALTASLGLEKRVHFLGFVSDNDLIQLYSNAFGVYFAPVDEDYGYITLEALLSHKPIITCHDSGGVLEFVENGKSAYVLDPSANQIADHINKLKNNPKLSREMGDYGYENVKNICWNNVIEKLTASI